LVTLGFEALVAETETMSTVPRTAPRGTASCTVTVPEAPASRVNWLGLVPVMNPQPVAVPQLSVTVILKVSDEPPRFCTEKVRLPLDPGVRVPIAVVAVT
jgi:hypothetical protein